MNKIEEERGRGGRGRERGREESVHVSFSLVEKNSKQQYRSYRDLLQTGRVGELKGEEEEEEEGEEEEVEEEEVEGKERFSSR